MERESTTLYPFKEIEPKWQKFWDEQKLFRMDPASEKEKYYCLMMFPYPSAALHVGHGRNYIIGDVVARYKMMKGLNVLTPMGWDAFGLPAENAAIKSNLHPRTSTLNNIKKMKNQLHQWGVGYDWEREINSCLPDYYRWTQWLFLQLYKKGLAYRKKAPVNWCPSCRTVLANEQVIEGRCERCETGVEQKDLEQWFFKITGYAERLLDDLKLLTRWPERVKIMQENWIGRSYGVRLDFVVADSNEKISCFTTRVDTLYGATYMVLAAEHPMIEKLIQDSPNKSKILSFIKKVKSQNVLERTSLEVEKEGVFLDRWVINPINGRKIPLWVANYVLVEYGSGAVMAVPAHDQRDFEFARKYNLPIEVVIDNPEKPLTAEKINEAYVEDGVMVNSGDFNGLESKKAKEEMALYVEENEMGERTVNYRLRDWLISRQRYWGAPIPVVYCEDCGIVPVEEEDLPILLPEEVKFKPQGESPLKEVKEFVQTKCPRCGNLARREIDTMDTFVDSSWYFLRFLSPQDAEKPFDAELVNRWLPVDQYIGGVEHAILHLLYARFITKVLYDLGAVGFKEPFARLFTQGMIIKDGAKMSKSRGNVVSPDELITRYGADTVRLYTLFIGPPEKDAEWNDRAVEGAYRFLGRLWNRVTGYEQTFKAVPEEKIIFSRLSEGEQVLYRKVHQTIKKVSRDIEEAFHFNTAISACMELLNTISEFDAQAFSSTTESAQPKVHRSADEAERFAARAPGPAENARQLNLLRDALKKLIILLSPFVPHIAEELWQRLGGEPTVFRASWPEYDPEAIETEELTIVIQINGKVRSKLVVPREIPEDELKKKVLEDEKIKQWLGEKQIKKFIIVPGKLVNIVV